MIFTIEELEEIIKLLESPDEEIQLVGVKYLYDWDEMNGKQIWRFANGSSWYITSNDRSNYPLISFIRNYEKKETDKI